MKHNSSENSFDGDDSWIILTPIEYSIKKKIESIGTPLKDWDVTIFRGVLTGCNEAFIITTEKRDEILNNCVDSAEKQRTAELIRPILRGRDIKRYGYSWADLWLINSHNGVKGKISRIDINDYPAVKQHLDMYWNTISNRSDQGDTPYNLRNCAYLDDFSKPKILWKRIGSILRFSFDESGMYGLDSTCFLISNDNIHYLCCVLNSKMGHYLLKDAPKTGTGDLLISIQAVSPIRIPFPPKDTIDFSEFVSNQFNKISNNIDRIIDKTVYDLYQLTDEEIAFIEQIMQ